MLCMLFELDRCLFWGRGSPSALPDNMSASRSSLLVHVCASGSAPKTHGFYLALFLFFSLLAGPEKKEEYKYKYITKRYLACIGTAETEIWSIMTTTTAQIAAWVTMRGALAIITATWTIAGAADLKLSIEGARCARISFSVDAKRDRSTSI
jgi:hypothetical protein